MAGNGKEWGTLFKQIINRQPSGGLAGFAFDGDGLGVAHVRRDKAGAPRLVGCRYFPCPDEARRARAASAAVDQLQLRHGPAAAVVDATAYQLLLVEAPDVPPDELRSAIRWRIKDLIDFHIDDAVIDVFEVPGQHSTGAGEHLMYAVAARRQAVRQNIDRLEKSGAILKTIDIPELCLRNVAALLPEDVEGVAFLYLARDFSQVVVTRQKTLYLARQIDTGYAALDNAPDAATFDALAGNIVLELQRSLDYYESHYGQASIGTIALAPAAVPLTGLEAFVREHSNARVITCDLNDLMAVGETCDLAMQGQCLPALGAALRVESAVP